jgi:transcriptional regulator with GAF, ATPase, and Fis domain
VPEDLAFLSSALRFSSPFETGHVADQETRTLASAAHPALDAPPAGPPGNEVDERARVLHALEQSGWTQAKAARLLGMTVRQLNYRIRKHGIDL